MNDLISFSPSLDDVLSLVQYEDVENCQLVSRRFYQVMKKNYKRVAKPIADVGIKGETGLCIVVESGRKTTRISVTEYGSISFTAEHKLPTKRSVLEKKKGKTSKNQLTNAAAFQTAAVEKILTVIFENFYVQLDLGYMSNKWAWTQKWYSVVSAAYRRAVLPYCRIVTAKGNQIEPALSELANELGCKEVRGEQYYSSEYFEIVKEIEKKREPARQNNMRMYRDLIRNRRNQV